MRGLLTLAIALFGLCAAGHVSAAAGDEPKARTDTFFTKLIAGKTDEAYNDLFVGSGAIGIQSSAIDAVKSQTTAQMPLYGKPLGVEFLSEEKFGTSLVRVVYLLKMEKHPLVWEFYFYKPQSDWVLSQVVYDDRFRILGPKVSVGPASGG